MKKSISIFLTLLLLVFCAVPAFAASSIPVVLCVEGISKTLYTGWLDVPKGSTVLDVLKASGLPVETAEDETGIRVVSIAGEREKTFGGTDGWYCTIGFENDLVAMDKTIVEYDDSIDIFYVDPAVGFQDVTYSDRSNEGYIEFYSSHWSAETETETYTPVVGATVVVDGQYTFVTNENGRVNLPEALLSGEHSFTIDRTTPEGLPTIVRGEGTFGYDPTKGPNLPVANFLSRVIDWFYGIFDRIKAFFKGLFK